MKYLLTILLFFGIFACSSEKNNNDSTQTDQNENVIDSTVNEDNQSDLQNQYEQYLVYANAQSAVYIMTFEEFVDSLSYVNTADYFEYINFIGFNGYISYDDYTAITETTEVSILERASVRSGFISWRKNTNSTVSMTRDAYVLPKGNLVDDLSVYINNHCCPVNLK